MLTMLLAQLVYHARVPGSRFGFQQPDETHAYDTGNGMEPDSQIGHDNDNDDGGGGFEQDNDGGGSFGQDYDLDLDNDGIGQDYDLDLDNDGIGQDFDFNLDNDGIGRGNEDGDEQFRGGNKESQVCVEALIPLLTNAYNEAQTFGEVPFDELSPDEDDRNAMEALRGPAKGTYSTKSYTIVMLI
jgi:hypothetical protein